jgi:glycosyltransferase involved in cell wall biosynthesis
MRIIIPSIQVPFVLGGAELMTNGLKDALIGKGHEVEIVKMPFKFSPESYILDLMDFWKNQDFNNFNGYSVDKVIVLQFPAFYVQHKNKTLWLMHQHRSVYELYNEKVTTKELKELKKQIHLYDTSELCKIPNRYSMCQNVTNRLNKYNHIDSTPVYHPPANEEQFYCDESYGYIFYPSRLEELKRQDLLIKAMQYTQTDAVAIIAGDGGQLESYKQLIIDLKVSDKISLIGRIGEEEKYTLYARSLAVFFAPYDEDYGYITLEAMLSSKPVITCKDSGGPLEFVVDKETGFVLDPEPKQIAEKIDWLYEHSAGAKKMGEDGWKSYKNKNISWDNVVHTLLGE